MTDPIEKAREILDSLIEGEGERIARAALDCLEALRGPRWGDVDLPGQANITKPVDLHAEAWKKFEETMGIMKSTK